jgi:hypothetical protein
MVDLEATIVVIIERDGRIQKFWFKKSLAMPSMTRAPCGLLKRQNLYLPFPKNWVKTPPRLEFVIFQTEKC